MCFNWEGGYIFRINKFKYKSLDFIVQCIDGGVVMFIVDESINMLLDESREIINSRIFVVCVYSFY
jgi:hypothetical protein